MDESDNLAQSIIPSAGFVEQPKHSQSQEPNKKVIIIAATIVLSLVTLAAILVAIFTANQKTPTTESESEPQTAEKPISSSAHKKPESVKEPGLLKTLTAKTNQILSHGTIANDSALKSISTPIFFTNKAVSEYYGNLSPADKMTIIVSFYQNRRDPALTDKQVNSFGSESCQLLFKESNCKTIKGNIKPDDYKTTIVSEQRLEKEYAELFGEISAKLPQQITNACPYYTYIKELSSYVYRAKCGRKNYKINHYYQYQYQTEKDRAYIYFAAGSTTLDNSGNYALLYGDIDAKKILHTQGNYQEYVIDKDNYTNFQHYRLVFKKESKNSNNYIFETYEKVDSSQ